jgi:hypothetical protein
MDGVPSKPAHSGELTCEWGDLRNEHPRLFVHVESGEPVIETPGFYGVFTGSEIPEHDFTIKA